MPRVGAGLVDVRDQTYGEPYRPVCSSLIFESRVKLSVVWSFFGVMAAAHCFFAVSSTLTHSQCDVGNIAFCDFCCFRCASP